MTDTPLPLPLAGQPDPTAATLARIESDLEAVKELFGARVKGIEEVFEEKIRNIDSTLMKVEQQRVEQKSDTAVSVNAALAAQEKSVAKTESGILEQLKQIQAGNATMFAAIDTKISDLKERVGAIESLRLGSQEQRTERRAVNSTTTAMIGLAITITLAAFTIAGVLLGTR